MISPIGLHKFGDLILGISQKLCYITSSSPHHYHIIIIIIIITSSPANEWRAIALACTHTRQYLFSHTITVHAILYMRSKSHYNTSTSVFSLPP